MADFYALVEKVSGKRENDAAEQFQNDLTHDNLQSVVWRCSRTFCRVLHLDYNESILVRTVSLESGLLEERSYKLFLLSQLFLF